MTVRDEPEWLDADTLIKLHDVTIAKHGGLPGQRDPGALQSALARPLNKLSYGETDVIALAAAYAFGLARNHAFSDGNKRIAYIAARLFLKANGFQLEAEEQDKIATFLALAAGDLSEDQLAEWLRSRATPL